MLLWHCCTWCSNETLLEMLIWGQWDHCSLFLSLLMLLWHCCTWCSNETLLEMLIWGQWVFVLNSWVSWCFCDTVAPDDQMRLCWKCWFEGNETIVLYFWVSWCFCDTVAPDVQMRLCGKCWFEGNETMFFISESPDAFVTLLHLMIKWDFVGNVDLRAMRPCS